jgi:hypothetical protein
MSQTLRRICLNSNVESFHKTSLENSLSAMYFEIKHRVDSDKLFVNLYETRA